MYNNILNSLIMEKELSEEQLKILLEQINRFNKLKENYHHIGMPKYDLDNNIILSKGTIIHGISDYDENKIENISKTGILTGQVVGKLEDGETYYCADFHRVKENTKIDDYSLNFKYNDGRCPFGNNIKIDNSNSLAFIIVPNEFNKELLAYDCYRKGTRESDITKSYITSMPLEEGVGSSILYGVPSSCFDGIVVGGKILEDNSKIKFLIDKFPNCYITSSYGELIYEPNKKDIYSEEIVNIKRENALLRRNNRLLKYRISVLTEDKKNQENNYNILWNSILVNCNNEDIAKVLISLGWQGNINSEYVENIKGRYNK